MQANEIRVTIEAPLEAVFEFTLEPKNTPKWVDAAIEMKTNTEQIGIGTKYSNEYITREVIDYERNRFIELHDDGGVYTCSYSFRKINEDQTEIIFFESHDDGSDLEYPLDAKVFEKLKKVLEK